MTAPGAENKHKKSGIIAESNETLNAVASFSPNGICKKSFVQFDDLHINPVLEQIH